MHLTFHFHIVQARWIPTLHLVERSPGRFGVRVAAHQHRVLHVDVLKLHAKRFVERHAALLEVIALLIGDLLDALVLLSSFLGPIIEDVGGNALPGSQFRDHLAGAFRALGSGIADDEDQPLAGGRRDLNVLIDVRPLIRLAETARCRRFREDRFLEDVLQILGRWRELGVRRLVQWMRNRRWIRLSRWSSWRRRGANRFVERIPQHGAFVVRPLRPDRRPTSQPHDSRQESPCPSRIHGPNPPSFLLRVSMARRADPAIAIGTNGFQTKPSFRFYLM